MRRLLGWVWFLTMAMAALVPAMMDAGAAQKKSTVSRKAASEKSTKRVSTKKASSTRKAASQKNSAKSGASKTSGKKTASKSRRKSTTPRAKSAPATTWRNRQLTPTPERYKEIQDALAAKGFLDPAAATGVWGQDSISALKKFQAAQNIGATGKIDSLSLIGLGLGPKREPIAATGIPVPSEAAPAPAAPTSSESAPAGR